MFDRIASRLGYVKKGPDTAPTLNVPPGQPDAGASAGPLLTSSHSQDAEKFDWHKAKTRPGSWGSSYSEEDTFSFALGRDGLMPLIVACTLFGSDPVQFIGDGVKDRWLLSQKSERFTSWAAANTDCFDEFVSRIGNVRPDIPDNSFAAMSSSELTLVFELLYGSLNPKTSFDVLSSSEAYIAFYKRPTMKALRESMHAAMPEFLFLAAEWFEVRGLEVDRENLVIRVPDYQALYLQEEQFL